MYIEICVKTLRCRTTSRTSTNLRSRLQLPKRSRPFNFLPSPYRCSTQPSVPSVRHREASWSVVVLHKPSRSPANPLQPVLRGARSPSLDRASSNEQQGRRMNSGQAGQSSRFKRILSLGLSANGRSMTPVMKWEMVTARGVEK